MLAHTIVLAVGLLFCIIGFILVFEIKEGPSPSNITGQTKGRLVALWILNSLELLFFAASFYAKHDLTWNAELASILVGIVLAASALVQLKKTTATAADPNAAKLSMLSRCVMMILFLGTAICFIYLLFQIPHPQTGEPENFLTLTFLIFVITVVAASVLCSYVKGKPDSLANESDPMPIGTRRILALYLVLLGIGLSATLWRLGSVDFSEAGLEIKTKSFGQTSETTAALETQSKTNSANTNSIMLYDLFAQATLTAVPVLYVTASGANFTSESKVRFNQQVQPTVFIDSSRIQAQLDRGSINSSDPVLVDVITKEQVTNAIVMTVTKMRVDENLLGWHFKLTRELQLLLLAILAGGLGSFIHALKSFGDFVGNRTLTESWFWWYITRPFLGAALAIVFYAVLRGGFMAGTAADAKAVNQFGVIAIGALVGMFADKASDKLADIFDTLFKGADNRAGKLAAPVIDRLDPPTIAVGTNPPPNLRIIGDRLGTTSQVKFDNLVHTHAAVSEKEITVPLTIADLAAQHIFKVSVLSDNGESPTKDLRIT